MTDIATQFPDRVIRASAGTGKTFQLTNRYLGLLHHDEQGDQILASTFARKAAGEILERILTRLAEAAGDDTERKKLEQELKFGPLTQARCAELLETVIRQIHRLRVGTLDSFFFNTAGSFALEFGLPGGWTVLDELDDKALRIEAMRRLLRQESNDFSSLITLVSLLQQGESSRDVLAGLLSTVDDFYSLFQESDYAAWHQIAALPMLSDEKLLDAIHDFREAPLPDNGHFRNAHSKSIEHVAQENWNGILTSGLGKAIVTETMQFYKKPLEPDLVAVYQPLIDHARAMLFNKLVHQTEATYKLLDKYRQIYEPMKIDRKGLRFEDITRILADNLTAGQLPQIEYRLDTAIHHLLLDEFQDTSLQQWRVIRHFSHEVNRAKAKSFFCVGDVKQAIYGWRGGEAEIFDSVVTEFPGIDEQYLTKSFRSSPVVIETVNEVFLPIKDNPSLFPNKKEDPDLLGGVRHLWHNRFKPHETAKTDYAGYCRLQTFPVDDEGKCSRKLQYDVAAEYVAELAKAHPGCSIAVLTRTNKTVAQLIYRLRNPKPGTREPVLASEEGGNPLTDSAGVIYLLSVLKLAAHPGDQIARFNVVHSPLAKFFQQTTYERDDPRTVAFSRTLRQQLLRDGYGKTIDRWVREMAPCCDRRELDRLEQLIELAWKYESRATLDPYDFVKYVEETRVESPSSAEVRVMTVHQSKGLQFDIVVLPELQGLFLSGRNQYLMQREKTGEPATAIMRSFSKGLYSIMPDRVQSIYEAQANRLVNEALCLLYVAMTRAVHSLHLLIPPKPSHATPAQLLVHALSSDELSPDRELFAKGNPDWYEHHLDKFRKPALGTKTETAEPIVLAKPLTRRKRNLEYVTPSNHQGGKMSLREMLQVEQSFARTRGSLWHAWFEQIGWMEEGLPDDDVLLKVAGRFQKPGLNLAEQLGDFYNTLEAASIRANLSQETYRTQIAPELFPKLKTALTAGEIELEVLLERRVTYRTETELVNGIADRLILYRQDGKVIAADVIDYKSDSVNHSSDVDQLIERYREQMGHYARAIRTLYHLPQDQVVTRLGLISAGEFARVG